MDSVNSIAALATLARATDRRQEKCGVRYGFYCPERLISLFANLPLKSLGQMMPGARLRETGQTAGAANHRPHVA
ncbi:MAG TPA: hypothetical protein VHT02_09550 [Methylocella sp.]|jgi:hypothetical protein|nr:hypothetical protein [Methylocella sp.]